MKSCLLFLHTEPLEIILKTSYICSMYVYIWDLCEIKVQMVGSVRVLSPILLDSKRPDCTVEGHRKVNFCLNKLFFKVLWNQKIYFSLDVFGMFVETIITQDAFEFSLLSVISPFKKPCSHQTLQNLIVWSNFYMLSCLL